MPLQENFNDVGTSEGPSWANHENKVLCMAWKGQDTDTRVFVGSTTTLQPDASGVYGFTPHNPINGPGGRLAQTLTSPAIGSFKGSLYLLWTDADSGEIFVSTSSDGATWSTGSALELKGGATAESSGGPSVATGPDSLVAVWKGKSDDNIYMAAFSDGQWGAQEVVAPSSGGQPLTDVSPAVAVLGGTVHLAWEGREQSGSIWWTSYSGGSWAPQKQLYGAAGGAPTLVVDGNSVLWMAWPGPAAAGNVSNIMFASLGADNKWSRQVQRFGVGTSHRVALASTGNSYGIMMAWKGQGTDPDIYYGTLRLPSITYGFAMLQTRVDMMRSGSFSEKNESDTDYASFGVQVVGQPANVQTQSLGNLTGGWYGIGLSVPAVTVEDTDVVIMTYTIINKGSGTNILGTLEQITGQAIEDIAAANDTSITEQLGVDLSAVSPTLQSTLIGAEIGADIGAVAGAAWGGVGAVVGAVIGFAIGDLFGWFDPSCDGPVANAYHYFNSETLRAQIAAGTYLQQKERNDGVNSQGGCGDNSIYIVDYLISSGSLPELTYLPNNAP
jgi:hypothetical protein